MQYRSAYGSFLQYGTGFDKAHSILADRDNLLQEARQAKYGGSKRAVARARVDTSTALYTTEKQLVEVLQGFQGVRAKLRIERKEADDLADEAGLLPVVVFP